MIRLQLDQELFAQAVTRQGLGVTVKSNEPQNLFPQLAELLNSDKHHCAARNFALKYAAAPLNRLERMVEVVIG